MLNLINEQKDIDKIYLYAKDLSEPKYEYLIENSKNTGIKDLNYGNAFIEYSSTMDDVYKNIDDYNPNRKRKILIVFDDMIADIMTNKKFQSIIKELFIRCRKLNISLVFITQSYFSVPKDVSVNSTHYLITKINNKIELQNVATNHSADIDYKDFIKIYRECTKEPYSFLTIDPTLPSTLRFRKNLFDTLQKMTVTDQIKILNRKIKRNESQYNLDKEAAKIFALPSKNLDNYELLTSEDLGLKPSTIEETKFEYSPLCKIFNKGLSEDDKNEGLLKRLKNIEDENKVKNKVENKNIKEITDFVGQPLSFEAKELINEIKTIQKNVDYRKLKIKGGNNVDYDFSDYRIFKELFRDLYYRNITIDEAESKQEKLNVVLRLLKRYSPKHDKYVTLKNNLVDNASKFYEGREKIIEGFKNGLFLFYCDRDCDNE